MTEQNNCGTIGLFSLQKTPAHRGRGRVQASEFGFSPTILSRLDATLIANGRVHSAWAAVPSNHKADSGSAQLVLGTVANHSGLAGSRS